MTLWRRLPRHPRTPQYRQGEHAECGLAALAILMGYHGVQVSLADLRQEAGSTLLGSTVLSLRNLARLRGFRASAHRVEPDRLAALGLPLIAHYRFIHFVVVERVSADWVGINDPSGGPRRVPFEEFADDFTGVVLRLERPAGLAACGRYIPVWRRYRRVLAPCALRLAVAATAALVAAVMMPAGLWLLARSAAAHLATAAVSPAAPASDLRDLCSGVALIACALILDGIACRHAACAVSEAAIEEQQRATEAVFASPTSEILSRGPQQTSRFLSTLLALRDPRPVVAALNAMSFLALTLACPLVAPVFGGLVAFASLVQLTLLLAMSWRRGGAISRHGEGRLPVAGFAVGAYASPDTWRMGGSSDVLFGRTAGLHALGAAEALRAAADGASLDTLLRAIDLGKAMACVGLLLTATTATANQAALTLLLLAAAGSLALIRIGEGLHLAPVVGALHGGIDASPVAAVAAIRSGAATGRLSLSNVSWRPARLRPAVVNGLSASASPGTILAIKGPPGSGLSTVARLAAGWLAPSSGEVLLGGVPLTQLAEGTCIFVDADVPLDSASLRDNLRYGHPIDDDTLCEALRDVGLIATVAARGGLELWIARERPALSGGELCRLAIARALCRRPAVLVLDGVLDAVEADLAAAIAGRITARGIVLVLTSARAETLALADGTIDLTAAAPVAA